MDSALTKLALNNQIVTMRHNVNRAKVQTINKLNKQVRMLRAKKATDGIKIKNQEKANKLLEELLIMKKIPPDEIAAFSLSNESSIDSILKDVESSPRLKSLAKLSSHKSISPLVKLFHCKYPDWKTSLPTVLIALKNRTKLDGEEGTDKANKQKRKKSQKKKKKMKNLNTLNNQIVSQTESNLLESAGDDMDVDNHTNSSVVESFVQTRGNRFSICSDESDLSKDTLKVSETPKVSKNVKNSFDSAETNQPDTNDCIDDLTVNAAKDISIAEKIRNRINLTKPSSDSPRLMNANKSVDPFFIGNDDEEYETCNPVGCISEESMRNFEQTNFNFDGDSKKFKFNKKNNNLNNRLSFNVRGKHKFQHSNDRKFDKNEKRKRFDREESNGNDFSIKKGKSFDSQEEPVHLHPSWEAKRKISNIVPFAGKKIVF